MFQITISWRVGRVDAAQNLSGHQAGPEGPRPALADLRLEIQREERLKDIEGQEGQQQEALNRIGAVHIDVVGMPAINQFVEPVVFDVPALVAEADGAPGGNRLLRKRGDPHPVAGQRFGFAVDLPSDRTCFQRTDDSHRNVHLGPGKQAREIPPQAFAGAEASLRRREGGAQGGRVLI